MSTDSISIANMYRSSHSGTEFKTPNQLPGYAPQPLPNRGNLYLYYNSPQGRRNATFSIQPRLQILQDAKEHITKPGFHFICHAKPLEVFSRGGTRSNGHRQVIHADMWRMYWKEARLLQKTKGKVAVPGHGRQ